MAAIDGHLAAVGALAGAAERNGGSPGADVSLREARRKADVLTQFTVI